MTRGMPLRPEHQATSGSPAGNVRQERLLSVSILTAMVKNALADTLPTKVHVIGQLSNFKRHGSGHLYFTLKDDSSELSCVMWRSGASRLKFEPENGTEVIASGNIDVFERAGRYQLYTSKLEPRGVGALELAFRQLRDKLEAQGLFDPKHKKPLQPYPEQIAVVTSATGAAVSDITQTLGRRYPSARILLCPVAVQGDAAAAQIAGTLADLNRRRGELGGIDLIIVGRGGGSLEDLWAFNEEAVARAIFASSIPVISAVGHEVDVSISDLVADLRAATPTAAAELAAPDRQEVLSLIDRHEATLVRSMGHRLDMGKLQLESAHRRRAFAEPTGIIDRRMMTVDELASRLASQVPHRLGQAHDHLRRAERLLLKIQPHSYAMRMDHRISDIQTRLRWAVAHRVSIAVRLTEGTASKLILASPIHRVARSVARIEQLDRRLDSQTTILIQRQQDRIESNAARLSALGCRSTLRRGYSITRVKKGKMLVSDPNTLRDGEILVTETADGDFESRVVNQKQMELFD